MAKRKVYTVSKRSSKKGWKVKEKGGKVVAKAPTKTRAVRDGASVARKQKRSSLIIRKANGADPRRAVYPERVWSRPLERRGVGLMSTELREALQLRGGSIGFRLACAGDVCVT